MNSPQKTSQQISREWADSLLTYLDVASFEYRHWDDLVQLTEEAERIGTTYWTSYTLDELRIERDNALSRFLKYKSSFACKE